MVVVNSSILLQGELNKGGCLCIMFLMYILWLKHCVMLRLKHTQQALKGLHDYFCKQYGKSFADNFVAYYNKSQEFTT